MSALQLVFKQEAANVLMTDSRRLAEGFGSRHDNLLQKIDRILGNTEDKKFTNLNFQVCYENSELQNGKPIKVYQMTRDGFMFIALTFTGVKGNAFRIKVLQTFNQMESELLTTKLDLSDKGLARLLNLAASEINSRDAKILQLVSAVSDQQDTIENRAVDVAFDNGKPMSAFFLEFPILREKALELFRTVNRKGGNRMTVAGCMTSWVTKNFQVKTLGRKVKGENYSALVYNRADILKVVEYLKGEKGEV